ncbi:MAG TPA: cation diffusion facilitator family transporter [Gammaproteobacteria bacterium]|nr:cation diffusion facilitator family transporter [Gammaproteobacteria bacterium]
MATHTHKHGHGHRHGRDHDYGRDHDPDYDRDHDHDYGHDHDHDQDHDDYGHDHVSGVGSQRALLVALAFTTFFAFVEGAAGWWAHSLALVGDAGHMIMDAVALGLGATAAWVSRRPPSLRHSYGFKRAEALGAMLNVALMLGVVVYIGIEATQRIASPRPVDGPVVMLVASLGLLVNLGSAWVLHRSEQNLNVKGAMLHVIGDMLGSVAALAAGVVIWLTHWYPIDPILSVVIAVLILIGSLRLLRDVVHVVMEGVPHDIDLERVGRCIASAECVAHVHDLHVWALDSSTYAVSAHVVIDDMSKWSECRRRVAEKLAEQFGIAHSTLQPEAPEAFERHCASGGCGPVYSRGG